MVLNYMNQLNKHIGRYRFLLLPALVMVLWPGLSWGQNYITNGDFEDTDTLCQVSFGAESDKRGFSYQPVTCIHPWGEYSNTQLVFNFNNYMASGHAAASLLLYKPGAEGLYSKSYLLSPLNYPMVKDSLYTVTFYCRLWHKSRYTTNALCLAFSDTALPFNDYQPLNLACSYKSKAFLADTGWRKVIFKYKATGAEQMIVLGNLNKSKTAIKPYNKNNGVAEVHCLIDLLSVVPDYTTEGTRAAKTEPPATPVLKTGFRLNQKYVLGAIYFESNSSKLLPQSFEQLYQVAHFMWTDTAMHLYITGYTDSIGTAEANRLLSQQRAEQVAAALIKLNAPAAHIHPTGKGETEPVAENTTEAGRRKNRRVEFLFTND